MQIQSAPFGYFPHLLISSDLIKFGETLLNSIILAKIDLGTFTPQKTVFTRLLARWSMWMYLAESIKELMQVTEEFEESKDSTGAKSPRLKKGI